MFHAEKSLRRRGRSGYRLKAFSAISLHLCGLCVKQDNSSNCDRLWKIETDPLPNILELVYKSIEEIYYARQFLVNLSVLSVSVVTFPLPLRH